MTSPPAQPVPWYVAERIVSPCGEVIGRTRGAVLIEMFNTMGWRAFMAGTPESGNPGVIVWQREAWTDGWHRARLHDERARAIEAADMEREYALGKAVKVDRSNTTQ